MYLNVAPSVPINIKVYSFIFEQTSLFKPERVIRVIRVKVLPGMYIFPTADIVISCAN